MNVIAVTVEYLLAGLLLLWIFYAPLDDDIAKLLELDWMLFVGGGVAYMLGVVADRVAEQVLDPVGTYETLDKARLLKASTPVPDNDPLPLERVAFEVRKLENGLLVWHDQLRGRLRLTRNALVYGHWAIIATWVISIPAGCRVVWPLPIVVSAALGMQVLSARILKIPGTNRFRDAAKVFDDGRAGSDETTRTNAYRERLRLQRDGHWYVLASGPLSSLLVLLLQPWEHAGRGLGFVLLSLGLWAMSRLAWTRIHRTFVGYMGDCTKHLLAHAEPESVSIQERRGAPEV
jgi:hypothetical protein